MDLEIFQKFLNKNVKNAVIKLLVFFTSRATLSRILKGRLKIFYLGCQIFSKIEAAPRGSCRVGARVENRGSWGASVGGPVHQFVTALPGAGDLCAAATGEGEKETRAAQRAGTTWVRNGKKLRPWRSAKSKVAFVKCVRKRGTNDLSWGRAIIYFFVRNFW